MYERVEREGGEGAIELLITADTASAIFTEALVALGDYLTEERGGEPFTHEVSLSAPDQQALLTAWLDELARLAATDGFIAERVVGIELSDGALSATVAGQRFDRANPVTAVACHQLELGQADGTWSAHVILEP